jgi:predicted N-acyltransferase
LKDRQLGLADVGGLGFGASAKRTFELDLTQPEDEMLARMSKSCRRAVRKSVKEGVVVDEASGLGFADEYYSQLEEVFARQSLRPTYGISLVRELIRCLEPTGRLLLLRALAPDGQTIATAISLGMNELAYMWGAASRRRHLGLSPNEALYWYEMRYWKARGMTVCDMGGGGVYKRKFGPREYSVPSLRKSRFPGVILLREAARLAARVRQSRVRVTAS